MAKCRQVSALVSKGLDKKLSFSERLAVRLHLLICLGCRNFEKQSRFLRQASQGYFNYLQKKSDKSD
jgi:hypothetical protein